VLPIILGLSPEEQRIDSKTLKIHHFLPMGGNAHMEDFYTPELISFLLDESRSKEHFVGGKEYACAAVQCLHYILNS